MSAPAPPSASASAEASPVAASSTSVPAVVDPSRPRGKAHGMSLKAFLTRLIWLCVVPLLLLATWLAIGEVRSTQINRETEATRLVGNFATSVDQYLEARIASLGMLAASPLAGDAARRAEFYQEAQVFQRHFGSHVILADTGMQMLFNTRVPLGTALPRLPRPSGRAAAPLALDTGAPAVGDVVVGPIANATVVGMAVPGKRDGKVEFLLLSAIETRQVQEHLDLRKLPADWSLALLDGTGATIARRAPQGFDSSRDVDPAGRYVVKSALSPWSMVLEVPRASYQAPLITGAVALALLILCATLVSVVGGTLASRRLVKALAALTAPAAAEPAPSDIAEIRTVRSVLDATAHRRADAEAALRRSERRFRLAASTGNVWDWTIPTGEATFPVEFWSGLGYAPVDNDASVAMYQSLLHPADLARWRQAMRDHFTDHLPYNLDYRIRDKSGRYRWFNTQGQAQWEDGRAIYIAGTTFDITARKLAEQEIVAQIELLTRSEAEIRQQLATAEQSRRALLGALEDHSQAEAARRISEQKLQLMLDAANIGHWDVDLVTKETHHSLRHDQIFGYGHLQSDWTYKKFLTHVHPADLAQVEQLFKAAVAAKTFWDFEVRITRADGALRWIWVHGNIFTNADGRRVRASGMVRDITERKHFEDAMRESEARYRKLFEYAPDGILVFSDDPANYLIDVNIGLCEMLGYSRDELTMMRPADIVAPMETERIAPAIAEISVNPAYRQEWQFRRRDGSTFTADVIATSMPEGNMMALIRDISERKRAEIELRYSEATLHAAMDGMSDAVFVSDVDGKFIHFNDAFATFHKFQNKDECARTHGEYPLFLDVVSPDGRLLPVEEWAVPRALRGEAARDAEFNLTRTDTGESWIGSYNFAPIKDAHGAIVGSVVTARDVTEQRRAEKAMLAYQFELSDLTHRLLTQEKQTTRRVAQALHDQLGQTLAVARLTVDGSLATLGVSMPDTVKDAFGRLGKRLDEAVRVVRQMLMELRPPMLDDEGLPAALENEIGTHLAEHGQADILLESGDLPSYQRWPVDVEYAAFMVAREAIVNARRHSHALLIRVVLDGNAESLHLQVIDDGVGVSGERITSQPGHLGVAGMRERAAAIGAIFSITSLPERGCRVSLMWKVHKR